MVIFIRIMEAMKRKKGQSLSEYSIFVAVILLTIIFMNVYVKRGLQGRYADIADLPSSRIRPKAALVTLYRPAIVVHDQYEPPYIGTSVTVDAPAGFTEKITAASRTKTISADTTAIAVQDKETSDVE